MSRMDRWAGQAMSAFIINDPDHEPKKLVRHAWQYAELMERERQRHLQETIVRGSGGSQAVV